MDRQNAVDTMRSGKRYLKAESLASAVRAYGDTAIVTGSERFAPPDHDAHDDLFTHVWQKQATVWSQLRKQQRRSRKNWIPISREPRVPGSGVRQRSMRACLPPVDTELAIRKAERRLSDAYVGKDLRAFDFLTSDDLTDIWDDGFQNTKRKDLESLQGEQSFHFIEPFGVRHAL